MSVVGPKSTADVRQFLEEATGLPVLGCQFSRSRGGSLVLACEYKDIAGNQHTKRIAMGSRDLTLKEQVIDLTVLMSEVIGPANPRMLELLTPETGNA